MQSIFPATVASTENNIVFANAHGSDALSEKVPEAQPIVDRDFSSPDNFDPGWQFYASFTSLCIVTLAVAFDATSLSVALPVSIPFGIIGL